MAQTDEQLHLFWENHIERWRSSDLTQVGYCQQHDLIAHRFTYWKRKLSGLEKPESKDSSPGFAKVALIPTLPLNADLSVKFSDGSCLNGINEQNLLVATRLIGALR